MINRKLTGTGTAMITPFKDNGEIDYNALKGLIEFQISNKIDYFVVMGTTSEYVTLNKTEREQVLQFFVEQNKNKLPIVLGIGGSCTQEVVEELKSANLKGVDAILSVTPYYNRPTQEGLYQHYKAVSESSPLPIIMYNVPGRTGVNMTAQTTLRLQKDFKNIVAIKEASGNINQIDYILRDKRDDFMVISGEDNIASIITMMGGSGVISVSSNAFPKQMSEMILSSLNGDIKRAREIQSSLLGVTDLIFEEGNPAGVKAVLAIKGLIYNNLRLPLVKSTDALYSKIKMSIDKYKL